METMSQADLREVLRLSLQALDDDSDARKRSVVRAEKQIKLESR
jgi:hypothetical protein